MRIAAALTLAVLALPGVATAQNYGSGNLGSRLPEGRRGLERNAPSTARGDAFWSTQAPCIAAELRGRASALIATLPGSSAEARVLNAANSRLRRCVFTETAVTLDRTALRSVAAVTLLPASGIVAPTKIADDKARASWILAGVTPITDDRLRSIHFFARCVAADAPDLAAAYTASAPASAAEGTALKALQPTMGGCLPESATFRTDRTMLRGLLAEALVKLAGDAPAKSGGA